MNHFLMTSLRSQQLSMQLASMVGLRVRRAGGVCSQAACHMLFLTISRCWGCRVDSQRPRQLLLPAAMLSRSHRPLLALKKGKKVGRSEI